MHVRRRHCWDEEDRLQPLMPCSDPLWLVQAPLDLARLTGIDVNQIPESQVSVFAVPVAEDDWAERGLRRWDGTRPEAMWHPLLWLPKRLSAPLVAVREDGEAVEEPLEMWQARVAFEVTDSQLYTDQGWVDVLALAGIDVDDPADVSRVDRWLRGRPDVSLDALNLEPFFADDQHTVGAIPAGGSPAGDGWSAVLAADTTRLLTMASTALMADSLLALAYDLTDPDTGLDDEAYARGAWWLATLASSAVAEGDAVDRWMAVLDAVQSAGQDRERVAAAIRPTLRLLTAVRDRSWPSLVELQRVVASLTEPSEEVAAGAVPEGPVDETRVGWAMTDGTPAALSPPASPADVATITTPPTSPPSPRRALASPQAVAAPSHAQPHARRPTDPLNPTLRQPEMVPQRAAGAVSVRPGRRPQARW